MDMQATIVSMLPDATQTIQNVGKAIAEPEPKAFGLFMWW